MLSHHIKHHYGVLMLVMTAIILPFHECKLNDVIREQTGIAPDFVDTLHPNVLADLVAKAQGNNSSGTSFKIDNGSDMVAESESELLAIDDARAKVTDVKEITLVNNDTPSNGGAPHKLVITQWNESNNATHAATGNDEGTGDGLESVAAKLKAMSTGDLDRIDKIHNITEQSEGGSLIKHIENALKLVENNKLPDSSTTHHNGSGTNTSHVTTPHAPTAHTSGATTPHITTTRPTSATTEPHTSTTRHPTSGTTAHTATTHPTPGAPPHPTNGGIHEPSYRSLVGLLKNETDSILNGSSQRVMTLKDTILWSILTAIHGYKEANKTIDAIVIEQEPDSPIPSELKLADHQRRRRTLSETENNKITEEEQFASYADIAAKYNVSEKWDKNLSHLLRVRLNRENNHLPIENFHSRFNKSLHRLISEHLHDSKQLDKRKHKMTMHSNETDSNKITSTKYPVNPVLTSTQLDKQTMTMHSNETDQDQSIAPVQSFKSFMNNVTELMHGKNPLGEGKNRYPQAPAELWMMPKRIGKLLFMTETYITNHAHREFNRNFKLMKSVKVTLDKYLQRHADREVHTIAGLMNEVKTMIGENKHEPATFKLKKVFIHVQLLKRTLDGLALLRSSEHLHENTPATIDIITEPSDTYRKINSRI